MIDFGSVLVWGSMSAQRQLVNVRDLVEEAKKRIVFLAVCVVGLSYLMSCKFPVVCVCFE